MTDYDFEHTCGKCGAQAEHKGGVVTVPHNPACPVLRNPLLIAARRGSKP